MYPSDLPSEDLLLQIGEEAAELSQAAIKAARSHRGKNPTPVHYPVALEQLAEEAADVSVALEAFYVTHPYLVPRVERMKKHKYNRWLERLRQ